MRSDLGKLTKDWEGINSIILYGAGIVGGICQTLFERVDLEIPFVLDRDINKQGTTWRGIPIISYEEAKTKINGHYRQTVEIVYNFVGTIEPQFFDDDETYN